jgi:hypothetical protein
MLGDVRADRAEQQPGETSVAAAADHQHHRALAGLDEDHGGIPLTYLPLKSDRGLVTEDGTDPNPYEAGKSQAVTACSRAPKSAAIRAAHRRACSELADPSTPTTILPAPAPGPPIMGCSFVLRVRCPDHTERGAMDPGGGTTDRSD